MLPRDVIMGLRGRLALGHVRPLLEGDECVSVWGHVLSPHGPHRGLVSLTSRRCLVHWTSRELSDVDLDWSEVTEWTAAGGPTGDDPRISIAVGQHRTELRMLIGSPSQARRASRLVEEISRRTPPGTGDVRLTSCSGRIALTAPVRGWRGHIRRVWVTVAGMAVIVAGLVFASPFVPGPGAVTMLAGVAMLAREYDWARDVHHWAWRHVERFRRWVRSRRVRVPADDVPDADLDRHRSEAA